MKIALLGYGTVGSGCMQALKNTDIEVKRVLDIREIEEIKDILTNNFDDILNDPEIRLVAELMGGEHPAYDYVKAAILAKKHVVTANKQMLSHHYRELLSLAAENGVSIEYSATAGGGIPWLYNLKRIKSVDKIIEIGGVMNGTTNFILDAMQTKGQSYEEALKEAQSLGYAEKDPTNDVEGYDVRAKLAISANIAFDTEIDPDTIPTQGITHITSDDIEKAKAEGKVIRLVGTAKLEDGKPVLEISPKTVDSKSPVFNLSGPENLFYLIAENSGMLSFKGFGAGKGPTGANVAADILETGKRYA